MVKFSKELEAQLIPEWKDAFVNYWQLKKHVKKIKILRRSKQSSTDGFGVSIFDPVRTLVGKISGGFRSSGDEGSTNAMLQMKTRWSEVEDSSQGEEEDDENNNINGELEEGIEREYASLVSEEDEVNKFMLRLDEELAKVNDFYEMKEAEFVERGESLYKQLQILLDLKRIVADRRRSKDGSWRSRSNLSSAKTSDAELSDGSDAGEPTSEARAEEVIAALERNGVSFIGGGGGTLWGPKSKTKKPKPKTSMRIDIPVGGPTGTGNGIRNPMRTISATMAVLWEDLVNSPRRDGAGDFVNRKKIQYAEKMIRTAYVEFYRGLGLLKTYSSLNMMAFTKILKKFDKVANRQESITYLRKVKGKHFSSSHKDYLQAHLSGMFSDSKASYMETIYPVFSMFALLSLHMFMYGCNLFMWKATRINYNFIFDFQSKTALKHRDAFLICTTSMTAVVAAMVVHLLLKSSGFPPSQVDTVPGCLLLVFITLLLNPFNMFYRPTRFCFLRVIRNIVCSPFYKVLMVDFFMADQLTSQIPLLRHLETTACYFIAGSFQTHNYDTCKNGKLYRQLAYVISFSPYYWRAMQCARRWLDESDTAHLANLGKYVSAMVAAGARLTYAQQPDSLLWMIIVLVTSVVATMYQLYWDFVKDWGFLNPSSQNPWLRDNLVLKNKCVYYISIALNVVLRVAWVESVLKFRIGFLESRLLDFSLASLEVIRRGHWNFYRLEHEHLNNVGKFRAEKAVPLPFREGESDD
ncbi:hypothetical protein V2J09_014283 [Rumex salicifolius]